MKNIFSSESDVLIHPILFHELSLNKFEQSFSFKSALYWAELGRKVVYISPTPLSRLPKGVGQLKGGDSDAYKNIKFVYLPRTQDLLHHLYGIHRQNIVSTVIIIQNLEHYWKDKPKCELDCNVALLCASLLDAAATNALRNKTQQQVFLIAFVSNIESSILKIITQNFFSKNVWLVKEIVENEAENYLILTRFSSLLNPGIELKFYYESQSNTLTTT